MAPRIVHIAGDASDAQRLAEAARIVQAGGLVAFPTETVYGLAADATNPQAIARLNRVKGRPPEKPYSWHVHSVEQVQALVGTIPPLGRRLIEQYWPGPLTIVLPARDGTTIGLRLPDHPITLAFLRACRVPVVAPSANRSGMSPPTNAEQVVAGLDGEIDAVIDAGPTTLSRESTVVQVLEHRVQILREGAISSERIASSVEGQVIRAK